jgi:hypothetical protein
VGVAMTVSSSNQPSTSAAGPQVPNSVGDGKGMELKDWAIFIPTVGSALALFYNVGFFNALDITFFSFFSISEHVLFAMEALPLTFVLAGVAIWFLGESASFRLPQALKSESVTTDKSREVPSWLLPALTVALCAIGVVSSFVFIRQHSYWEATAVILAIITTFAIIYVPTFSVPMVWMPYAALALSLFGYAFGSDRGFTYKQMTKTTHLIYLSTDPKCLAAIVILSGTNGVLFIEQHTNRLNLLRWSDVTRISSNTVGQDEKCAATLSASPAPASTH